MGMLHSRSIDLSSDFNLFCDLKRDRELLGKFNEGWNLGSSLMFMYLPAHVQYISRKTDRRCAVACPALAPPTLAVAGLDRVNSAKINNAKDKRELKG